MIWAPEQAYRYAYANSLKFPADACISEHFFWNEVFKNQEREEVPPIVIFYNAKKAADELEKYRNKSGIAINIHRWWSSPNYNRLVVYKNAKNPDKSDKGALSLHTLGFAIDFDESGKTSEQTRLSMLDYIKKDLIRMRLERGTQGWVHADTGHPYIPNGFIWGLFYP